METVIDWNEAPEWATGHGLIAFQGITRVWFNDEQYAVYDRDGGPYPWGGGKGDTRHNHTRPAIEYPTNRPAPWTGEGLPPVGTVCEHHKLIHGEEWTRVEIVAHRTFDGDDYPCAVFVYSQSSSHSSSGDHFRPCRKPEQIAEEEHRKAVEQLAADTDWILPKEACEAVLAAGYRKQVQP